MEQEVGGSSPPNCTTLHSLNCRDRTAVDCRDTSCCGVSSSALANPRRSPTIPPVHSRGGLMTLFRTGNFQFGLMLATALSVSMWPPRPGLHARTGAGLHRRRVPPLRRRNSRCRPRDGLHGRQKVPALAGLPGAFQARSRAARGRGQAGRPADGDPAARRRASARLQVPRRASAKKPAKSPPRPDVARAAISRSRLRDRLTPCGGSSQ